MLSFFGTPGRFTPSAQLTFALTISLLWYVSIVTAATPHHSASHTPPLPPLSPRSVRIDHRYVSTHPDLVIDTHQPAFDWQLDEELDPATRTPLRNVTQSAYRLVVSRGDVAYWDSGRVLSSQSVHVVHSGPPFISDT